MLNGFAPMIARPRQESRVVNPLAIAFVAVVFVVAMLICAIPLPEHVRNGEDRSVM